MIARRALLGAPAVSLLLAQCGPAPPPPAVVEVQIKSGKDQNPDTSGAPVAVAVRLYALNASGRFSGADVYALMERERATLGEESNGSEEAIIRPGENRKVTLNPKTGTRFLGVAVLFRDIDRATWRQLAPVFASGLTEFVLTINGATTKLEPA